MAGAGDETDYIFEVMMKVAEHIGAIEARIPAGVGAKAYVLADLDHSHDAPLASLTRDAKRLGRAA